MWTQQLPNIHIRDYPAERCIFVGFHHGFHDEVVVQTCDTLTLRSTAAVGKLTKRVRPCDGPGVSALRLYHLWSLYHRFASCGPCTTAPRRTTAPPPLERSVGSNVKRSLKPPTLSAPRWRGSAPRWVEVFRALVRIARSKAARRCRCRRRLETPASECGLGRMLQLVETSAGGERT